MTYEEWAATVGRGVTINPQMAFAAGAASRDAEIAELVGVLGNVTAHLVAAHSLLSRGGKKAAASDTIFKIMLQDYEKSFEAGRKALDKVRKT